MENYYMVLFHNRLGLGVRGRAVLALDFRHGSEKPVGSLAGMGGLWPV